MSRADSSVPALLRECLAVHNGAGQALAEDLLSRNGYRPVVGDRYTYGEGTIPVLLVAHTDTVHKKPPSALYFDPNHEILWSPDGLGADDRAGVYGIASLLALGLRPHVLFTDEEETGGHGAQSAAHALEPPDVRLMIQLDRRGADDAVYYSCDNPGLRKWIKRRGFQTAQGSFTDISILMPAWGIAGANLSVGYYREHTTSEHLRLDELRATLAKVEGILRKPPRKLFEYQEERQVPITFKESSCFPWSRPIDRAPASREETVEEEYRRLLEQHGEEWERELSDDWRDWKYDR